MAKVYLKRYGHELIDNGYEVVGITPGTKHPSYDYSSKKLPKITHKHIDKLLSNGHARDGVGIRSRYTPMVDIDVQWGPLILATVAEAEDKIGYAPRRIGAAPKVGLIYRAKEPFDKVQSKAFTDPEGRKAQLEIQGDGQQWVAYAIHPDTKKPYRWPDKDFNIRTTPADDLVEITEEKAVELVQWFENWCLTQGWERWKSKSKSTALTTRAARDPDDISGSTQLGLTIDEVRNWVERLENDENVEYEDNYQLNPEVPNYRNVIFAIWHETEGSEEGREIAEEWSAKSPKHEKEPGRFFKMWNSADPEDRDDAVTFRYVIKCVLIAEEGEKREQRDEYLTALRNCTDPDDLKELAQTISKTRFEGMDFERLAQELKRAFNRVTGFVLSIADARKQLYHQPSEDELPIWVKPWNYIRHTSRFFNRDTGEEIEHKSYEAAFSRYLGGASAVNFALNKAQIKTFWNIMYKPDEEEEFWFQGHDCLNTFSDRLMPEMPGKLTSKDRLAIAIVEAHLENMLPDARERALFLSFLAYVVQTRDRPNWMIVFQGVEGDGKSFFAEMMGAILGSNNVRMLDAQQLEQTHTGWAVGQLLAVVEELKIHGHSRFDIMNRIKPFISNPTINVHPKHANNYTAINTTAYIAFTNFIDAVPLGDNDRRYMILKSRWQTGEAIRKFEEENPSHFAELFGTIRGSTARSGALRQWLMEYPLHPDFNAKGRAPITAARKEMIDLSKSDVQVALEELIEANTNPQVGPELIVASALASHLYDEGIEKVQGRALASLLSSSGYVRLPHRIRVNKGSDNVESIWVKDPSAFRTKMLTLQRRDVLKVIAARTTGGGDD